MLNSKFVGATGAGGTFHGKEITEAQARFEAWLLKEGWQADDDGEKLAEDLLFDYLAKAPDDEDNEEEIETHSWDIGRMKK
jgi:hypothetical protein